MELVSGCAGPAAACISARAWTSAAAGKRVSSTLTPVHKQDTGYPQLGHLIQRLPEQLIPPAVLRSSSNPCGQGTDIGSSICDMLIMLNQVSTAVVAKCDLAIPSSSNQSPGLRSYQALENS